MKKNITKVFAYKGFIGIKSSLKPDGLINNPDDPGQLGFVLDAEKVHFSKEAIKILQTIERSKDDLGGVSIFKSDDGRIIFSWLGGNCRMINPAYQEYDNDSDPSLLYSEKIKVIRNAPPKDFCDVIDKMLNTKKE